MWLKLSLLLFLLPLTSFALSIKHISCESQDMNAQCSIELLGEVQAGDSLMISQVRDIDTLYYKNNKIGSTGFLLGRKFYAAYFPRLYPLESLEGKISPTLRLDVHAVFSAHPEVSPKANIQIISEKTPLRKVFLPPLLLFLEWNFLLALSLFLVIKLHKGLSDGWTYPRHEFRTFIISSFAALIFQAEFTRSFVPWLLSRERFYFLSSAFIAITLWSISKLLLHGRFSDRSCVERSIIKPPRSIYDASTDSSLLFALVYLSFWPNAIEWKLAFAPLFVANIAATFFCWSNLEWKRIWKRSSMAPLIFHISLPSLALALISAEIIKLHNLDFSGNMIKAFLAISLFAASLRVFRYQDAWTHSQEFVEHCRQSLADYYKGEDRLQGLCELFEQEFGFARVSLISVREGLGLVLASAGPDAIHANNRVEARSLGPFLRRVCKEKHILYAPVAAELGKELQNKGLKHSSLGIPLLQENRVVAVLCIMADEDERIPPYEAIILDLSVQNMRLEIVSAVLQSIAEERNERVLSIARASGGLTIEHVDTWGRIHSPRNSERIAIYAKIHEIETLQESLLSSHLQKIIEAYRSELRAIWFNLREQFEFLSNDIRLKEFSATSPQMWQNPYLRELGQESCAVYLALLMEKHARLLSLRDDYLALGISGAQIALSTIKLQSIPLGVNKNSFGMDIAPNDLMRLQNLSTYAAPGNVLLESNTENIKDHLLDMGMRIHQWEEKNKNFSITMTTIDKKEIRKIEQVAIENAREQYARKSA